MGVREEPPCVKEEVGIVREEGLPIRREHQLVHKENMKKMPDTPLCYCFSKVGPGIYKRESI